jgi:toxin ParE1/3/4
VVDVRIRRTAKVDLHDIGKYTRSIWSAKQAERYIDDIMDVIELIAEHPLSGQNLSGIRHSYRWRRAGHHLVFYAVVPDGSVEIIRILHEKSDALRHLDPSA